MTVLRLPATTRHERLDIASLAEVLFGDAGLRNALVFGDRPSSLDDLQTTLHKQSGKLKSDVRIAFISVDIE